MKAKRYQLQIFLGRILIVAAAIAVSLTCSVSSSRAQDALGGHVGFVLPLVTRAGGQTTSIADNFTIGFPMGITVKGQGRMAFDMEFVPFIQKNPRQITLTVHPGVVWSVRHGVGVGVRAAFDINSSQFGFTPLVNKSWTFKEAQGLFKSYFVEADLPVRFNRPPGGPSTNPVTFAVHFGVGF